MKRAPARAPHGRRLQTAALVARKQDAPASRSHNPQNVSDDRFVPQDGRKH